MNALFIKKIYMKFYLAEFSDKITFLGFNIIFKSHKNVIQHLNAALINILSSRTKSQLENFPGDRRHSF